MTARAPTTAPGHGVGLAAATRRRGLTPDTQGGYGIRAMAHTVHNQEKLLQRIRRIRGQVNAVEQALVEEQDCSSVLMTLAATRGAINSLMSEVLEGHVRFHVLSPAGSPSPQQKRAADELIEVVRTYLK